MENQLNFRDLIRALDGTGLAGEGMEAFQAVDAIHAFVNPELLVKEGLSDLASEVVLISARGAAGKSTAAVELSKQIGAPLWRLEKDKAVSGTSLGFNLSRYLGTTRVESVLGESRPTIIIDSLDEARSRVSGTSWTEFLQSLADISQTTCRLVLLGRERSLEEVWLSLAEAGRKIAWLEISHFGVEERLEYIDSSVRRRKPEVLESVHYGPARDAVLASLVGAVPGESALTFAGYAPVLDAVAAVLQDNANLYSIPSQFDETNRDGRHLLELEHILTGLLERDQLKLGPLANELALDPASVYKPEEQIDWLCHDLAGAPAPALDHITDLSLRGDYTDKVRSFLDDHPFRDGSKWASAVFRAYVAARRFGTTISGPGLLDVGHESGLLFDLVTLDDGKDVIDDWQFAALHASITAGEFSGTAAAVTASDAEGGLVNVTMSLQRVSDTITAQFILVPRESGEVRLFGPLEGLTVETNGAVAIPARGIPIVLGPDLFIHCDSLTIEAGSVEFAQRGLPVGEDVTLGGVVFEVEGALQLPPEIARRPLDGDFELRVSNQMSLAYPWISYRQELPAAEIAVDPSARAVRFLNMLMNLTRTHGHRGDRGAFVMKLQGRQSIKGEEFQRVLSLLENGGVIRLDGSMVFLNADYENHRFSGKTFSG